MSRVISIIAFIILLILLLILFRQCSPTQIQTHKATEGMVSEGVILRSSKPNPSTHHLLPNNKLPNTTFDNSGKQSSISSPLPSTLSTLDSKPIETTINSIVTDNESVIKESSTADILEKETPSDSDKPLTMRHPENDTNTTTNHTIQNDKSFDNSITQGITNNTQQAQASSKIVKNNAYIILQGVSFRFGSATLLSSSSLQLQRIIARLQMNPKLKVEIAGYTDNTGDSTANKIISQLRAKAVRDYFISNGIEAERLIAIGYGDNAPIADNSTPFGRKKNRRVEIHIKNALNNS